MQMQVQKTLSNTLYFAIGDEDAITYFIVWLAMEEISIMPIISEV